MITFLSTWLVELTEQDFYDQINSISLLKDYLKIYINIKIEFILDLMIII